MDLGIVGEGEALLVDGDLAEVHQEVEVASATAAEVGVVVVDHFLVGGEDQGEALAHEGVASEQEGESICLSMHFKEFDIVRTATARSFR